MIPILPHDLKTILTKACALRRQGDVDDAIALLQETTQLKRYETFIPEIAVNIGECYLHAKKDYAAAIPYYMEGLRKNPRHIFALVGLAKCHSRLENWDESEKYVDLALEVDPGNTHALGVLKFNKPGHGKSNSCLASQFGRTNGYQPRTPPISPAPQPMVRAKPAPVKKPAQQFRVAADVQDHIRETMDRLVAEINLEPKSVGKRSALMNLYIRVNDVNAAREQAEKILSLDNYNSQAKRILTDYPAVPAAVQPVVARNEVVHPQPIPPAPPTAAIRSVPPDVLEAVDEVTFEISVDGHTVEVKILIPASDEPLRIKLVDPERAHGKRGFVVARQRGQDLNP